MTDVPLDQIFGLVTNVRDGIFADYATDANARMEVRDSSRDGYVLPLLSYRPDGPTFEKPCGAFYSWQTRPAEMRPNVYDPRYEEGCGVAGFELLPRMPKHQDEITGLVPEIKPLISVSAGRHIIGTSRCVFVRPLMPGEERMIHYLPLMPLVINLLMRFGEQLKSLPEDFHWREDVSHLFEAA